MTKLCKKCGVEKELELFSSDRTRFDGKSPYCKECRSKEGKESHIKNRDRDNIRAINYYFMNKEATLRQKNVYENNKSKNDINFRLRKNLRSRLSVALKKEYKSSSAIQDLGCSIEELKIYLESMFQIGMSWSNYGNGKGKWNIDHIKPLAVFDLTQKDQLIIACNYKNLQPLWSGDNVSKGAKYNET